MQDKNEQIIKQKGKTNTQETKSAEKKTAAREKRTAEARVKAEETKVKTANQITAGKPEKPRIIIKAETVSKAEKNKKINTPCPVFNMCGGCVYLGESYESQLAKKEKKVRELLKGICQTAPITGMKNPYHYRNKVNATFQYQKGKKAVSGIYQEGTHKVVKIDNCLIEDTLADQIICSIRGLLESFKIRVYDEDSGYGLLRHVMVRRGFATGQTMVVLVAVSPIFPSKNNFMKALLKLHPEITTIVLNVNDRRTSMVLGERNIVLYGKGYIEDKLCGCMFRLSPNSFYQVNPIQTEALYAKAIALAGLTGKETVIDAYCGIGTIGLIASEKAKNVIGVELNPDAVKDAVINARCNKITNAVFYEKDAGKFMIELAEQGASADVVFMDPPRQGSDEAFLSSVSKMAPARIVYISCNPETLARDLRKLEKFGYQAEKAYPFDLFCWTEHTETICKLSRK